MITKNSKTGKKRITLVDVVVHMQHMEQRLTAGTYANTIAIQKLDQKLTIAINDLKTDLTARIDSLQEDLTATMLDFIKIRKFVGMPTPDED